MKKNKPFPSGSPHEGTFAKDKSTSGRSTEGSNHGGPNKADYSRGKKSGVRKRTTK